jgi:hypothetical protein
VSLGKKGRMLLRGDLKLIVEGVVSDLFHIVPVGNDFPTTERKTLLAASSPAKPAGIRQKNIVRKVLAEIQRMTYCIFA